jgi:hypothetical protein
MTKRTEKGQTLVLFTIIFMFVVLPITAWVVDQGLLYFTRRSLQKVVDSACLAGAIAQQTSHDEVTAITESLTNNGIESQFYTPNEGTGTGLLKGIEIGSDDIRVAVLRPSVGILAQFLGNPSGWPMLAQARCESGIGGPAPLALKEWEGAGSEILITGSSTDCWGDNGEKCKYDEDHHNGTCSTYEEPYDRDPVTNLKKPPTGESGTPPSDRSEENCWVWGDWQILAGDGHNPNYDEKSMSGVIIPDIRCPGSPSEPLEDPPSNTCPDPIFIDPPVDSSTQPNTIKDITQSYVYDGGYYGPEPYIGDYKDDADYYHSPLVAIADGVNSSFVPKAVEDNYPIGSLIVVFVYSNGFAASGSANYDYVEIIGYAVAEVVYYDNAPNTVAVKPVFPTTSDVYDEVDNNGLDPQDALRAVLPKTIQDIIDAGFQLYPILLPWEG